MPYTTIKTQYRGDFAYFEKFWAWHFRSLRRSALRRLSSEMTIDSHLKYSHNTAETYSENPTPCWLPELYTGAAGHDGVALHNATAHQNQSSNGCDIPPSIAYKVAGQTIAPDHGREERICNSK
jgi:hypothetical protein